MLLLLLLLPNVWAISNVQHSLDGTRVTLTYDGTPPFLINIRGDQNIGQPGGYVWAKTDAKIYTIDLGFANNPSGNFNYGVKDTSWSSTNSFTTAYIPKENVFVIEDDGTLIYLDGEINRGAITKKFYEKNGDYYDFIVIYTTDEQLRGSPENAIYTKNDVK